MKLRFNINNKKQFFWFSTLSLILCLIASISVFFGGSLTHVRSANNEVAAISQELSKHDTSNYNRVLVKASPKKQPSIDWWEKCNEIGNERAHKKNAVFSISKYNTETEAFYVSGFDLGNDNMFVIQDLKFIQNCYPKDIGFDSIIISSKYADELIESNLSPDYVGLLGLEIDTLVPINNKVYRIGAIYNSSNDYMCTNTLFTKNFGETFFILTSELESVWSVLGAEYYTTFSPSFKNNIYFKHLFESVNSIFTYPDCFTNENFDKNGTSLNDYISTMYSNKAIAKNMVVGILLIVFSLSILFVHLIIVKSLFTTYFYEKIFSKKYAIYMIMTLQIAFLVLPFIVLFSLIQSINVFGAILITPSALSYWILLCTIALDVCYLFYQNARFKKLNCVAKK